MTVHANARETAEGPEIAITGMELDNQCVLISEPSWPQAQHTLYHRVMHVNGIHTAVWNRLGLPEQWPDDLQDCAYWRWERLSKTVPDSGVIYLRMGCAKPEPVRAFKPPHFNRKC